MSRNDKPVIHIDYFSDVLCIWAYVAQVRVDEMINQYASRIDISYHFFPVFGCTAHRIGEGWKDRGGFKGYNRHVLDVAGQFDHIEVNPGVWLETAPSSSASCHHFLTAVRLLEEEGTISGEPRDACDGRTLFEETTWRMRRAFFRDCRDVGRLDTQFSVAEQLDIPAGPLEEKLQNGEAMAAMCRDSELRDLYRVEGSPTYILNNGRQKLYGDVGYKIIDANIREILNRRDDQLSWC